MKKINLKKINLFDTANYGLLILISIIMLYPFWHVVMASFMTGSEFLRKNLMLFPRNPTLENFTYLIFETDTMRYLTNTILITVIGTISSLFFTTATAYGLSKKFPGQKFFVFMVVATMFIYPGLIPNYINYKALGLINTRAILILVILIAPFYVIILRSNFSHFPEELLEAARIDGLGEYSIYFRIVLPLSKAILAAVGLFIAVNYWNMMLPSVFFVTDNEKKMIQDYLYRLLVSEQLAVDAAQTGNKPLDTVLRLTAITIGITPIILVYPFLQKYFIKGALIGSIKG